MTYDSSVLPTIPQYPALAEELSSSRHLPRNEGISHIKGIRTRELDKLAETFNEHINEMTGLDVSLHMAGLADVIIRELAHRAFVKNDAPKDWNNQIGLFAIGGYGRGELNPYSDIDLLVLCNLPKIPSWLTAANAELQASLWDVKYTVGASMRGLSELLSIIDEDFVTATAVLEQRPIIASQALCDGLQNGLERFRKRRSVSFLKYKLDELEKRREQAGVSLFVMEPNLKTNPGCLRDVQLLRNISFLTSGSRNLLHLSDLEVITLQDLMDVSAANDHLLRIRTLLHFKHKRKQDIFQLPDQLVVAKLLGYQAVSQLRAVEYFMKHHYALLLHVHQTVELTISRLRAKGFLGKWTLLIKTRKTIDANFSAVQGQVYIANPKFWTEVDVPLKLFKMCRIAQQRELRLSLELQRVVRSNLDLIDENARNNKEIARIFLEIIGDLGRTQTILEDMHNCGLLGAYMPEFGNLTCHMQFDSYHQFTVDQHTLFAMGNLDGVATGRLRGLPGMPEMLRNVKRKDLLGLGLLMHDVGKYMGRGHVARGAMMVAHVAERMGLDQEEEDLVYWLVDRHVSLSDASRMRDFHEPEFLKAFSAKMENCEQLDMLYCLTYADARAVGEGVLTGWQESILQELHATVSDQLRHNATGVKESRYQRLVRDLQKTGITEEQAQEFIRGLGQNYLHQVPKGEVERHYEVYNEALNKTIGLSYVYKGNYIYLAAAIPDRKGLYADLTAALTGHGFDILDARSWISISGMVIYSFRTSCIYLSKFKEENAWEKLRKDLVLVSKETLDVEKLLDKRRKGFAPLKNKAGVFDDPAVKVEQRTSASHTIVDVHVENDIGLLSRLGRAITDYGCDIGYTSNNLMGDVAVAVFYVTKGGKKISTEETETFRQHLIQALGLKFA